MSNLTYYSHPRRGVIRYIPAHADRILEIGYGTGATLAEAKKRLSATWIGGVELNSEAAERAQEVCDRVWNVNIEDYDLGKDIAPGSLDAIMCLDLLEHLVDPWTQVERLSKFLKPGGILIATIPNIRYYKVGFNLYFRGDFRYRESGILDKTHLRFFVKETIEDLMQCGGLDLVRCHSLKPPKPFRGKWVVSKLTFSLFDDLSVKQYIAIAKA